MKAVSRKKFSYPNKSCYNAYLSCTNALMNLHKRLNKKLHKNEEQMHSQTSTPAPNAHKPTQPLTPPHVQPQLQPHTHYLLHIPLLPLTCSHFLLSRRSFIRPGCALHAVYWFKTIVLLERYHWTGLCECWVPYITLQPLICSQDFFW